VGPKYEFVLIDKGIVERVAVTFSGHRQYTFGSPRHFPPKSSAKIQVLKDGVLPEMQMCHPQDPQNRDY
jgi:hypothetical protein